MPLARGLVVLRLAGAFLLILLLFESRFAAAVDYRVERLNGGRPIMSQAHFQQLGVPQDGANINGPSVIRIPDWIPAEKRAAPSARYYMYFAHHKGKYIRLAWAETIEGPWQLHNVGTGPERRQRGVLDMGDDRELPLDDSLSVINHIASPDVHVDNGDKRIVMYFHGPAAYDRNRFKSQKTFVAISQWGLDFSADLRPVVLAGSYLRVFEYEDQLHGIQRDKFYRSLDAADLWVAQDQNPDPAKELWSGVIAGPLDFSQVATPGGGAFAPSNVRIRHSSVFRDENWLYIVFSMTEHSPERIFVTLVNLEQDCWHCCMATEVPREILKPELPWEGSEIVPRPSKKGMARGLSNALRDPYVFIDNNQLYLFYVGGGESAIGVARLTISGQPDKHMDGCIANEQDRNEAR